MLAAVREELPAADALIMSAAVADFRPARPAGEKIKKEHAPGVIELEPAPDVLRESRDVRSDGLVVVGFALETERAREHARRKLESKGLDLIVLNEAGAPGAGFEVETNQVVLIDADGGEESLPLIARTGGRAIWTASPAPGAQAVSADLELLARYLRQRRDLGVREVFLDELTAAEAMAAVRMLARGGLPAARQPGVERGAASGSVSAVPSTAASAGASASRSASAAPATFAAARASASGPSPAAEGLRLLATEVMGCTRCRLHAGRNSVVFGEGTPEARLFVVSRLRGEEDRPASRSWARPEAPRPDAPQRRFPRNPFSSATSSSVDHRTTATLSATRSRPARVSSQAARADRARVLRGQ